MTRPFFETLRELRRGQTLLELADKLAELTAAVVQTQKPGKLTLQLTLAPAGKRGTALLMTDKVTLLEPLADQASTIFFPTSDFQLSRNDPNQLTLKLQSAAPPGVDPETGELLEDDFNPEDLARAQRDIRG